MKIKSQPLTPCFKSCFEIALSLPDTTNDKPYERLIKSMSPSTWHRFVPLGGSVFNR